MPQINNRNHSAGRPQRHHAGRSSVKIRTSVLLTIIFVVAVLVLVGIYIFLNDVKMPVVLCIAGLG